MHGYGRVEETAREIARRKNRERLLRQVGSRDAPKPKSINPNLGDRKMFYFKHFVREHERALLFRDGDFVKFLVPGVYRFPILFHRYTVERFDMTVPTFGHRLQDFLIEKHRAEVERYFDIVATGAEEIAIRGSEACALGSPGRRHSSLPTQASAAAQQRRGLPHHSPSTDPFAGSPPHWRSQQGGGDQ